MALDEISESSLGSVHRGDFIDMLGGTSVLCLLIDGPQFLTSPSQATCVP